MPRMRRMLFLFFVAGTLVLTFMHLAGFSRPRAPQRAPPQSFGPTFDDSLQPFVWAMLPIRHPIDSKIPLPAGEPPEIPRIQHDFSKVAESASQKKTRRIRLSAVREAFKHSWSGYRQYAWRHDEVAPLSGNFKDPYGGWGATLVDTLDTLWIMNMEAEFADAVHAAVEIDFTQVPNGDLNVFETTIRYLGGFLSAYDLSNGKYPILLDKAVELGEMLYRAFDTPNHMPIARWDWKQYVKGYDQVAPSGEAIAEIGSLTLEFTRLSQLTSDPKYFDAVQRVSDLMIREQNQTLIPGLWPLTVNPQEENMHSDNSFTLGGMADSVYEYLPKEYLLLGGRNEDYRIMHLTALKAIKKYLVFEPLIPPSEPLNFDSSTMAPQRPLILGTARATERGINLEARGEHLACFAGGMIALGTRLMAPYQSSAANAEDVDVARRLAEGCIWSYNSTPTGIGPELFITHICRKGRDAVSGGIEKDWKDETGDCTWSRRKWLENVAARPEDERLWESHVRAHAIPEGYTEIQDTRYLLRPEAIETIFMMYRITGDPIWQDHGWRMFERITSVARTSIAFAVVPNVFDTRAGGGALSDGMESFWTAETLKYFYLLFADEEVVSLDEYVFNTEAHPLRWRTA